MSAAAQLITEEIENLDADISRAESSGGDASHFRARRQELLKRLRELSQGTLDPKKLLKG